MKGKKGMINSREELLEQANKISNQEERVKFIMNYFLQTANFNYAYLLVSYTIPDDTKISLGNLIANKSGDPESTDVVWSSTFDKTSKHLDGIMKIKENCNGNLEEFTTQLRNYLEEETKGLVDNDKKAKETAQEFTQKIITDMRKTQVVDFDGTPVPLSKDITRVLAEYRLNLNKAFPKEIENGLIKKAVCNQFSTYLIPLLREAGIDVFEVQGTSDTGHSWIIAKIGDDYKSLDLTRAIERRDGATSIPKEQTSEDWLYADIEKMFEMQSTRTITNIDGIELKKENTITSENFEYERFKAIVERAREIKAQEQAAEKNKDNEGER